jgi:LysR family hydrogen peroxide-inducible transcriptional activator
MKLRDLQYLVAVYDHKNFSKAAEKCFVSQPTLSGQLKKLEEELGVPLMERSTRHVMFTEAGERVVTEARQMLAGVERIKATAAEFEDPLAGDFHLGLIPTVGPFLLPEIMADLQVEFPQMTLFLHERQTEVLLDRLLSGKIDAAILAKLDWDLPLAEWHLYTEPLLLAVPEKHPLANVEMPLKRNVLDGQSLLMLEDGHCLRDQAMGVCFAANAHEDDRYQATSIDTLLHMISVGHGMTLVPELAARKPLRGIKYKRFESPQPDREVVLIGRSNSARSAGLERLAQFIASKISS